MKRDWMYASKDTVRQYVKELALNTIADVIWGENYEESKKLHMIEGIMTLAAEIDEDMTEVDKDAQADD